VRLRRRLVVSCLAIVVGWSLQVASAAAYVSTGTDPSESGSSLDITGSTRRVWHAADGRRYLEIGVTFTESGSYFSIQARVDARGDEFADSIIYMFSGDGASGGKTGCKVKHAGRFNPGALTFVLGGITCRVRLHHLHPTKRVRWRLLGRPAYAYSDPLDHAPDKGWYGELDGDA